MSRIEGSIFCDNCGAEITWTPFIPHYSVKRGSKPGSGAQRKPDLCCQDCYIGYACRCGERMDFEDERRGQQGSSIEFLGG